MSLSSTNTTPIVYENNNELNKKMTDTETTNSSQTTISNLKPTHNNTTNNNNNNNNKKNNNNNKKSKSIKSSRSKRCCNCIHLNNLWSLWYGIFGTALQIYIAVKCIKRLLGYSFLNWPDCCPLPYIELNCSLGLIGAAILLLPVFLLATVFKIGNLANDGFKLGRQLGTCSREPSSDILANGNCALFRHGGPTAPFVHIVLAFCFLIPKLLMEARLIEAGFLTKDSLWRTDLDFMGLHKDRMIILSFVTANSTLTTPTTIISTTTTAAATTPTIIQRNSILNDNEPKSLPFTNTIAADTVIKTLKDIIGHENHTSYYEHNQIDTGFGSSLSIEFINLIVALMIYSIRYPALFWSTNKCLGSIFSLQLLINGLHTLLGYAGMSILYKVQIMGGWEVLPLLKPETTYFRLNRLSPFLLNSQVTLLLYVLSTLLILASSLILYLYGHTRFVAFLNQEHERRVITLKKNSSSKWSYFAHCAALCVLIAVGVCNAPILHDYTILYKGSLDDTTLVCIIGGILHLFTWIVVWLFLTIKQNWIFKLRVTVGRATVRQARSLRLITDIDLMTTSRTDDLSQQPLLIVSNGRTYNITETSPKRTIMNVVQKTTLNKKSSNHSIINHNNNHQQQNYYNDDNIDDDDDDDGEQIYWLRPALITPQSSPDETKALCWSRNKLKHKVTFNDINNGSTNRGDSSSSKCGGVRGRRLTAMDEDDGDYATLRELPLSSTLCRRVDNHDDTMSEEGKLLACVHDEHVTYASNNQDLVPPVVDYEDPSPLLTPEPLCSLQKTPVIVHNHDDTQETIQQQQQQQPQPQPRCLRRIDSGVPHDELTPKSESESSPSPPGPPGSNHSSDTSSGIHSNDSGEQTKQQQQQQQRRANSVVDLVQNREEIHWKSSSLQRTVQNPLKTELLPPPPPSPPASSSTTTGVILENPVENTVVIRRKINRPVTADVTQTVGLNEEPFGRATNMRMISFMEKNDNLQIPSTMLTSHNTTTTSSISATLPHFPTQTLPQNLYQHCSTLPPQYTNLQNVQNHILAGNVANNGSCNIYNRHKHTTLPTHHNGVKLFHPTTVTTAPITTTVQGTTMAPIQNAHLQRFNKFNSKTELIMNNKNNLKDPIYTGLNYNKNHSDLYHRYNS